MTAIRIVAGWAGRTAVLGDAAELESAFAAGTPLTVTEAPFTGDVVYLGHNDGARVRGLDRDNGDGTAIYCVDVRRLDAAPTVAAYRDEAWGRAFDETRQADADEDAYLNPRHM